jgi:hypothetical protein
MTSATRTRLEIVCCLVGVLAAGAAALHNRSKAKASSDALAQALLEVRGEMCSGRNLKGTGVRMEVFASSDVAATPLQSGLVPVLDMNVTPKAPIAAGQTVRWSGWLKAPASGAHQFHLPAGVRGTLTVSKRIVLDAGTGDTTRTDFEEARFYPFTLVVTADHAATDAGTWLLSWSQAAQPSQPVTRGYLFPPTDAVTPSIASGSDK